MLLYIHATWINDWTLTLTLCTCTQCHGRDWSSNLQMVLTLRARNPKSSLSLSYFWLTQSGYVKGAWMTQLVDGACSSWFLGCDFKPHIGFRVNLKKKKRWIYECVLWKGGEEKWDIGKVSWHGSHWSQTRVWLPTALSWVWDMENAMYSWLGDWLLMIVDYWGDWSYLKNAILGES